ncbi:MAG: CGNR zinc finger domain-containing protein [Stackebrandtia sp.]
MNFNSHTDAVVAYSVELVNLLTAGHRRGKPYEPPRGEYRRVAIATALSGKRDKSRTPTHAEAEELSAVARRLRVVFDSVAGRDVDSAAEALNRLLRDTDSRPHLARHDGEPWHIHFHGAGGGYADNWAAGCATALAVVVGSELYDRLGTCTAQQCDRVYVDTSRNGARRFCSTSCQNRVKTAAFRARERPSAGAN